MQALCLYFQIHQPLRLRQYRFFDIGNDHYYYDDYTNESIIRKIANDCYLPANAILLDLLLLLKGKFKVSFSITGLALDQFEQYAPEVIESFQKLAATGCVEFLAETYSHSLVSLNNKDEFTQQIKAHSLRIEKLFRQKPQIFRNTELIYSDDIGKMVAELGFKGILTEGAKHILGWKSPNYLYCNAINPKLKILMRNYLLSDDIAFRFTADGGLTSEKFTDLLNKVDKKEDVVNIFMDYETFGERQVKETGIFDFLTHLPKTVLSNTDFQFFTPSEVVKNNQPVSAVHVPYPISWANEERDLTAWLGNYLQDEAYNKLYKLRDTVHRINDKQLNQDWKFLQASDHFHYMCTKFFTNSNTHTYFSPYKTPYDAFINYMNVLNDFKIRLTELDIKKEKSASEYQKEISEKNKLITQYKNEIKKLSQMNGPDKELIFR